MLKRTAGIVLKNAVFGEADLIVTYLTPDKGLMKAFARGPRKTKSRFGSSLEPLTYSRISLFGREESNLPKLTQSDIIKPFHSLREEFKCLSNISEILELNLTFLPEKEPGPEIFKLLLNALIKLETDCSNRLYFLYYKIRFLEITGYAPRLDVCGRCGNNTGNSEAHNFYISHGSIICPKCISERDDSIKISGSALKFYKSLLKWNFMTIDRIIPPEYLVSEISSVINSHIRYVMGPLKYAVTYSQP